MQEARKIFALTDEEVTAIRRDGALTRPDGLALKYEAQIPEAGGVDGVSYDPDKLPCKYNRRLKRHRNQLAKESRRKNRR